MMLLEQKPKLIELLQHVLSIYNKPASPFLLELFWSGLKTYTLAEVSNALQAHCTNPDTGAYPPKPSDIIRHLSGTSQERALLAWGKVQDAIPMVGAYRSVVFDDALIHAVIAEMGGWVTLCQNTEHELVFRGKDFQKRYCSYASRNTAPPYPNVLKGRQEGRNELPMFVGDKLLAEQVYATGGNKHPLSYHPMTPEEMQRIQKNIDQPNILGEIVHFPAAQDDSA